MLLNCGAGENSWESLHSKEIESVNPKRNQPWIFIERTDAWSWSSNIWATWCKELTHWKILWCWERSRAGQGDDRGWGGWMASSTQWTWVWASLGWWWRTGKPSVLQSMESQRVGYDWVTEIIWFKNLPFQWVKSDFMKMGCVYVWKVQIPAPSPFTTNVLNYNVSLWDFHLSVCICGRVHVCLI